MILMSMPQRLKWVRENEMTEKEKEENPNYQTTGGILKHLDDKELKSARQKWWNELHDWEKNGVLSLPNFDKEVFREITGIDVEDK